MISEMHKDEGRKLKLVVTALGRHGEQKLRSVPGLAR
jgi:hypothetical protein